MKQKKTNFAKFKPEKQEYVLQTYNTKQMRKISYKYGIDLIKYEIK